MDAMGHFWKYKEELKLKPHLNHSLFWAGKMARVGSYLINSNLWELGYYPELMKLIIEEYNYTMIEILKSIDIKDS